MSERNGGFIIVAVLWILGALATLVAVYSLYLHETAVTSVDHDERLEAHALATAGVELAAYQITARPDVRPLFGGFDFRQGNAAVHVDFRGENSLIDLNYAPKDVLAGLFIGFGAQQDEALDFADRIVAWRTPLQPGTEDAEAGLYQAAGKNYGPRHGPFQHVNELGLVAGLPPPLIDRVLPYLTVYSGHPQINVLSAPPAVLAALPGLTPQRLQTLLSMRADTPQDVVRAQLGIAAGYITMGASGANKVTVTVAFPTGGRFRSQADIFVLDRDTEPYRVLSWHDDLADEGSSTLQ